MAELAKKRKKEKNQTPKTKMGQTKKERKK